MITVPRRVSLNFMANISCTVLNALCGFVILPFLIHQLGREGYGLWTLIVATAGYFLVLDLGVNGALGRLIAAHRAKGDIAAINEVLSTSLMLLLGIGVFVAILTLFLRLPFFWLFDVPTGQAPEVGAALLIVGLTTALSFPGTVSYGFLWGYERFDLLNLVEIPTVLVRTGLTLWLIHKGSSLIELALIVSGSSIASYVARSAVCWRLEPKLRIRPTLFSRSVGRDLFNFGTWFSVLTFSRAALPNVAPFVIGHALSAAAVTTFTIPRMLTSYSNWIMLSATQIVAPRSAVFHFGEEHAKQEHLFLMGGRYACALSLYFVGGSVLLGMPFLTLWQGEAPTAEYILLLILILGEALPMSQWITYNAVVSMGRHRRLALFALAEGLLTLLLAVALVRPFGLVGVACATSLSACIFRGVLQWAYGCSLLRVSLPRYAARVFLPTLAAAALAFGLFGMIRFWLLPQTWGAFLFAGALYTGVYWAILLTQLPPLFGDEAEQPRPRSVIPALQRSMSWSRRSG